MRGTGTGGHELCNYRLAIHWAGVLSIAAFAAGTALALMKIEAAVIILVFGIPVTVVGGFIGYLGGRAAASQQISAQTANVTGGGQPSAANVENQTVNTTDTVVVTQPPAGAPTGAGETEQP